MPESQFWHEMNPARLIALYDAHFGRQKAESRVSKMNTRQEPTGLYSAIMEMGGI